MQQLTSTIRTAVTGLMYLATFLFGANCVGLLGLTVQLLVKGKPESSSAGPGAAAMAAPPPQQQQEQEQKVGSGASSEPKP